MAFNPIRSLASNLQSLKGVPAQVLDAYWRWVSNEHLPYIESFKIKDDIGIDIDQVSEKLIKRMFSYMGFPVTSGDGYTSTKRYFNRQLETLAKRIKWKTTKQCYQYEFYIYMLYGSVIPLVISNESFLVELDTDFFDDLDQIPPFTLDYGLDDSGNPLVDRVNLRLDQNLPNVEKVNYPEYDSGPLDHDSDPVYLRDTKIPWPILPQIMPDFKWYLDNNSIKGSLTRCFKIKYKPLFIENTQEFWSKDTARAFYNDVVLFKRLVEHPYFEPQIYVKGYNAYNSVYTQTVYNEDTAFSALIQSVYIKPDFTQVKYMRIGNSKSSNLNFLNAGSNPISGSLVQQFDLTVETGQQWYVNATLSQIQITPRIPLEGIRWLENKSFSEIALHDQDNKLVFYACFPTVHYTPQMLSSIFFQFDLEAP